MCRDIGGRAPRGLAPLLRHHGEAEAGPDGRPHTAAGAPWGDAQPRAAVVSATPGTISRAAGSDPGRAADQGVERAGGVAGTARSLASRASGDDSPARPVEGWHASRRYCA